MHGEEQRKKVVETFIRFDHGYAGVIAEPGYPNRRTLRLWRSECREHGKSVARTKCGTGCLSRQLLAERIDELAPDERKTRSSGQCCRDVPAGGAHPGRR